MREIPAPENGTRIIKNRQTIIAVSGNPEIGTGHYLLSSRGIKWERMTNVNPKASTPAPASTNVTREGGDARSTIAAKISSQPVSNSKNPTNFIPDASGRNRRVCPAFAMPAKISHSHPVLAAVGQTLLSVQHDFAQHKGTGKSA